MKKIAKKEVDLHLIRFLLKQQADIYVYIFHNKLQKEEAITFMENANTFFEQGWITFFTKLLDE